MSINIQERFQKMGLGEKIILIAGPLLFIDGFLRWYDAGCVSLGTLGNICGTASGWQAPGSLWSILAILIGIAMSAVVGVTAFTTVQMPALPQGVTWPRVHLGLAAAASLLIIIKLLNHSGDLAYGFFIAIVLVAALDAGAFLLFQAEQKGGSAPSAPSM